MLRLLASPPIARLGATSLLLVAGAAAQTSPEVVFSSISTSATSMIPGGGVFRTFPHLNVAPSGQHWVLEANSTSSSSFNHRLLIDGVVVMQEFSTLLPWNTSQAWRGGAARVNDHGLVALNSEGGSATDYLVSGSQAGTGTWTILEDDLGPATGVPGGSWTGFNSPTITADGRVGFVGFVNGATSGTSTVASFDGQILAEVGVTVPTGAVATGPILSLQGSRNALTLSADGQHYAYFAALGSGFAYIVDGAVRVESRQVLPGSGYTRDIFRITSTRMEPNGDWFAAGLNEVAGHDWVVRNGAIIAEEFQPIVPGSTEVWGNTSTLSPSFFGAIGHESGDYIVVGGTRNTNAYVMVRNGTDEIARLGDPIDLDGNGLFDDNVFLGAFQELGGWGANGALYATVSLNNAGGSFQGYAVVRFDLPGTGSGPGTVYCQSAPNSTGSAAQISLLGSTSVTVDDLTIACEGVPTSSFGFFIASLSQGNVQGPGGSQGTLCLSGNVGRQVGGVILQAPATGRVETAVHLNALPTPNGPVTGAPGEAWNFQYWFRDANPQVTSNFSSGISVTLQ